MWYNGNFFCNFALMDSKNLFEVYKWLVDTIRRSGRISFKDLSYMWQQRYINNGSLPRSTFNRYREAVFDLFGIDIRCDRSNGNVYYIANDGKLDSVKNWMVSSLAVNNMITESRSIHNRIILEPIPFSDDFLPTAIAAMKQNRLIELVYKGYGNPERNYIIEPYCIRLFRQRWYILGHFDDKFRLFSFDRIKQIKASEQRFKMPEDFDCEGYFDEYFGMLTDSRVPPHRIVLRAHGRERYYLRDLPLHYTQQEIGSTEDTTDFELYLRPTNDFIDVIFSRGGLVEILSPVHLKDELLKRSREMIKRLSDSNG